MNMKICLVYDRINKIGGAEKVLMVLHELWPNAPIYTMVYDLNKALWAKDIKVISSFVQRLPFSKRNHEWYFWLAGIAFESFDFSGYDVVVSVTSAEAKGIITDSATLHICYMLTPTKYLWSHTHLYRNNVKGWFGRRLLLFVLSKLRIWDQVAALRADVLVAISKVVSDRVRKYYKRQVDSVIYPPVEVESLLRLGKISNFSPIEKDYFLIVSRLVVSKRVDVVIKVFNKLDNKKLVVVGDGVERKNLEKIAGANVFFKGQVDDEKLVGYYKNCKAVIFVQEEDFGIVSVEAMAFGKPVVAYNKGGVRETVISNKTGVMFSDYRINSIIKAIEKVEKMNFDSEMIKNQALKFEKKIFKKKFKNFVEEQWRKHKEN